MLFDSFDKNVVSLCPMEVEAFTAKYCSTHTSTLLTGRIQFEVLTTLPLEFQIFYDNIENLNHTIGTDINFIFSLENLQLRWSRNLFQTDL